VGVASRHAFQYLSPPNGWEFDRRSILGVWSGLSRRLPGLANIAYLNANYFRSKAYGAVNSFSSVRKVASTKLKKILDP
jgi:hypothetical protein